MSNEAYLSMGVIISLTWGAANLGPMLWRWVDDAKTLRPQKFLRRLGVDDDAHHIVMTIVVGTWLIFLWLPTLIALALLAVAYAMRHIRRMGKHMSKLHQKSQDPNTWEEEK